MKKCFIAQFVIILIIFILSSAYAVEFSFDQITGIIDSTTIDDEKLFTKGAAGELQTKEREGFFTEYGAAMWWTTDDKEASFLLYDNDSYDMHMWIGNNEKVIKQAFSILTPILDDYIDYNNGAKMTFIITKADSSFSSPLAKIEYSPIIDKIHKTDSADYNEYYSDVDAFNDAVVDWFSVAFGEANAETIHKKAAKRSNHTDGFKILEKGSKGDEVHKLQERLNELGYSVGNADGDFGNKTKTAIEAFQQDHDLEVTGIVDETTYNVIFSQDAAVAENGNDADEASLITAGMKYISNSAMEIAPTLLGVSESQCRITEIYCLNKGDKKYQFTARVSRGGPGGFGIGKDLTITPKNDGGWDIADSNHITMYGGTDTIPGDLVFGDADETSIAKGMAILAEELKKIDFNGDGELSMDEIFEMN